MPLQNLLENPMVDRDIEFIFVYRRMLPKGQFQSTASSVLQVTVWKGPGGGFTSWDSQYHPSRTLEASHEAGEKIREDTCYTRKLEEAAGTFGKTGSGDWWTPGSS